MNEEEKNKKQGENEEEKLLTDQKDKVEEAVGQGVTMGLGFLKGKAKQAVGALTKKAIAAIASFIGSFGYIIVIALVVIIFIVSFLDIVGNLFNFGTNDSTNIGNSQINDIFQINENGITMSNPDEMIAKVKKNLEEAGFRLDSLGLGSEEKAKNYLFKFYQASMATQIPYIPTSEVKGIIRVKRTSSTVQEARELTWITHEKFAQMIEEKDASVQNYYALDENWNLCISTTTTRTVENQTEQTITEVKIPYQTVVSQYSVPFRYLMIMLQVTQNPEYISYMCDMFVEGKQIDFTIFDSIQTTTDVHTYTYYTKVREKVEHTSYDTWDTEHQYPHTTYTMKEKVSSSPKTETTTTTTITNTITANITYANTWLAEITNEYTNESNTQYPLGEEGQTADLEDEEEPPKNEEGSWRINQTTTAKSTVTSNTWTQAGTNGQIKESEFLGLWKNETGTPQIGALYDPNGKEVEYPLPTSNKKQSPLPKLLTAEEFMFELLERYEDVQSYSDIMKYMLYKYTGKDYGVTSLDIDIFKSNDFKPITGIGSGSGTDIALFNTMFSKEVFVQALQDYAASSGNQNFIKNFLPRAEEIYDLGIKYHMNPELIVTMALKESGFKSSNGNQNFWGLDTPNGSKLAYIGSFETGVQKLADRYQKYADPSSSHYKAIVEESAKRQAAGCNPNGYGAPTSLKGFLLRYSDLIGNYNNGYHTYGNWGHGGTIYLEKIYGAEFDAKCGYHSNGKVGAGGHTASTKFTIQEKADYTAYLYEQQLVYWNKIFGKYGTLGTGNSTNGSGSIGGTSQGGSENLGYTAVFNSEIGTFKLFKQGKGYYSSQKYIATTNVNTIADGGCCPTSVAIIATGYGIDTDPGKTAELLGGTRSKNNSSASGVARVLRNMGLKTKDYYSVSKQTIKQHLLSGGTVAISVYGGNPYGQLFANRHHWMTLLAINEATEEVFVGNPSKESGWYPLDKVIAAANGKWWVSVSR